MNVQDRRISLRSRPVARHAGRGSAYLMTLMVLTLVTILGLSLSLTMQTERQLSANERGSQETFYAADSGTSIALARSLWRNRQDSFTFLMNRRQLPTATQLWAADRVCVSPMRQLTYEFCDKCGVRDQSFWVINQAVLGFAERLTWSGGPNPPPTATATARRSVSKMMRIQPWAARIDTSVFDTSSLVSADGSLIEGDCALRY